MNQIGDKMNDVFAPAPVRELPQDQVRQWKRHAGRLLPLSALLVVLIAASFGSARAFDYVVQDTFNIDTADTSLPQHTLEVDEVGGGWIQSPGADFRITLDGLATYDRTLDGEPGITVVDTLVSEYDLSVNILLPESHPGAGSVTGVVFRYVDEGNHFAVIFNGKRLKLVRVSGGVETVLDERPLNLRDEVLLIGPVRVRHDGITVEIEGHQPLETDDDSFAEATLAGLIFESVQTTSFRDFTVSSVADAPGVEPGHEPASATVFDTFTASSGTPIESHAGTEITSGGPWSALRGSWQILDGTVKLAIADPVQPGADQIAVIPAGSVADQEISADIAWHSGTAGVVWNTTDTQNYSLAFWDGSYLVAGRVEAGVFREFGRQRAAWAAGQTRNLRIRVNEGRARVYLDGSEPLMMAIGIPAPAVINAGVFVRNGGENRFDNFVARPSQPLSQPDPAITGDPPFPPVFTEPSADAWLFDSFNSPDSVLLKDRSPEIDPSGQGWTPISGLWQIWQAQASEQTGVFGPEALDRFAVIDSGVDEYQLEAWIEWDGGRAGVLFGGRATGSEDAGRNGFIFFRNGERLEVGRLIGGVYFPIDSSDDFRWRSGQRKTLRVQVDDGEAVLSLDGAEMFRFTDSALRYSTWAGLFQRGRNDERFNDFTVTLPDGSDPPSDPALGPVADVEMRVGESLVVPIDVIGPAYFKPELSASATRTPGGTVVFDSFSSSPGEEILLVDHVPGTAPLGTGWVQVRPGVDATVDGGKLRVPIGGDGGDQRVVIDTGYPDVEVSAVVTAERGRAGLVARHDGTPNDSNWVMGWVDTDSGLLFLGENVNSVFRLLGYTAMNWTSGQTRAMSMTVAGTDVKLSVDGQEILAATVSAELTGTHAGLFTRSFLADGIFDDFKARGLGLPSFITLENDPISGPALRISPEQPDAGIYEVVIVGEQASWLVSASFGLSVSALAGPTADTGGPYVVAEGLAISLDASGSVPGDSAISEYEWDLDGDDTADLQGQSVDFLPLRTGEFTVRLTVTDENGLISHSTTELTVVPPAPEVVLADMVLVGEAVVSGSGIVLTPDELWRVGAAWTPSPHEVTDGFTATFSFRIDSETAQGADGIAFVVQGSAAEAEAIGDAGDGIGYSTIENSLVVEFDTWVNAEFGETRPHVAVHSTGTGENSSSDSARLASVDTPLLTAGAVIYARVEYEVGTLRVFMNDFSVPLLEMPVDLAALLDLPGGEAYVGFTASTGGASESHTVLSLHMTTGS